MQGLVSEGTAFALAFKHADGLAGLPVEYAADEIGLSIALHAPAILPGLFACEFFAAEEVHFSPLPEGSNKSQTAQMFPDRDAAIQYLIGTTLAPT